MKSLKIIFTNYTTKGFIIPLTLIICFIILTISTGISSILSKELYFSQIARQSQLAYYAADDALTCAITIDDSYVNNVGQGIFPYSIGIVDSQPNGLEDDIDTTIADVNSSLSAEGKAPITTSDIKCAGVAIFDTTPSTGSGITTQPFNYKGIDGKRTTYSMRMPLSEGKVRCASVTVSKTSQYRQIIARGFASCPQEGRQTVERAIINTVDIQ